VKEGGKMEGDEGRWRKKKIKKILK